MKLFVFILEMIGTVAFAVSGAMTGMKKKMDVFGIIILGLTTAVGGGVLRDLILGITPPRTFRDPSFALSAIAVSAILFIPTVRHLFMKNHRLYDIVLFVMDSLGLGIFSTSGVLIAYENGNGDNIFLLLFVGTLTGVGGGVIRDMLAGDTPYIFVKHIYACASLFGAFLCWLVLYLGFASELSTIIGATAVVVVRFMSAKFKWNLPRCNENID